MGMYDWEEFHNYEHEDAMKEPEVTSVECTCTIEASTEKAYLMHIKEMGKSGWLPASKIKHIKGDTWSVPVWLIHRFRG
jgi:hypothetical protein